MTQIEVIKIGMEMLQKFENGLVYASLNREEKIIVNEALYAWETGNYSEKQDIKDNTEDGERSN